MTVRPICRSSVTTTSAANITELGTIWETEEKIKTLTGLEVYGWLVAADFGLLCTVTKEVIRNA